MLKPKSSAKYTPLPSAPEEADALLASASPLGSDASDDEPSDDEPLPAPESSRQRSNSSSSSTSASFPPAVDPRFVQPTPSAWKRALLLGGIVFLFWLTFQIKGTKVTPKVVHASRYSKEFKYRPAASPILTETLKDGRLRVRGAGPTSTATPTPTPTLKTKKRSGKKRSGKSTKRKSPGTAQKAKK
ncbi:hypothetical protein FB451DRAFT_1148131 [Mycena latifolia]|nr:hypothetical protein FB451DRAFT_1148131 [Mycena latifolia]